MWELKIKACEPSQHCKYLVVLTEEQKPGALAIRLSETETTHSQAGRACLGSNPDRMPVHFFLEGGPPESACKLNRDYSPKSILN